MGIRRIKNFETLRHLVAEAHTRAVLRSLYDRGFFIDVREGVTDVLQKLLDAGVIRRRPTERQKGEPSGYYWQLVGDRKELAARLAVQRL